MPTLQSPFLVHFLQEKHPPGTAAGFTDWKISRWEASVSALELLTVWEAKLPETGQVHRLMGDEVGKSSSVSRWAASSWTVSTSCRTWDSMVKSCFGVPSRKFFFFLTNSRQRSHSWSVLANKSRKASQCTFTQRRGCECPVARRNSINPGQGSWRTEMGFVKLCFSLQLFENNLSYKGYLWSILDSHPEILDNFNDCIVS